MGNYDVDCVSFLKIDRHIEYAGMLYQGAPNGYGVVIDNLHRNITLGIFAAWELKTAYQNELSELLQKADAFQAATFYETNIFLGEVFCQRKKGVRQGIAITPLHLYIGAFPLTGNMKRVIGKRFDLSGQMTHGTWEIPIADIYEERGWTRPEFPF